MLAHKPKASTQRTTVAALALPIADVTAEIAQLKRENPDGSSERSGNRRHASDAKRAEILQLLLDAGEPLATADLAKTGERQCLTATSA